jgi:hypothetical protein
VRIITIACKGALHSRPTVLSLAMADLDMCCEQDDPVVGSTADWLAALSERARAQAHRERADRLLLLAWQAYDGQEISLVEADVAEGEQAPTDAPTSLELHRAAG